MYSASLIAAWFVNKGIDEKNFVTQMKLQKIVFFAQGLALHELEKPLVNELFEAWKYGPVIPILYSNYRIWGSSPITEPTTFTLIQRKNKIYNRDPFSDEVEEILNFTWDVTKDIRGEALSNWTHSANSPWDICYKKAPNTIIPNELIKKYFDEVVLTESEENEN